MGTKNVISLARARALKETFEALHSPEAQAAIYAGAMSEFKRLISPAIRELLSVKGASRGFQDELITALEKTYSYFHLDDDHQRKNFPR